MVTSSKSTCCTSWTRIHELESSRSLARSITHGEIDYLGVTDRSAYWTRPCFRRWVEKEGRLIKLFGSRSGLLVTLTNLPEGEVHIDVNHDCVNKASGILIGAAHGMPIGVANVVFLPGNEIRVKGRGKNGYAFDYVFVQ